MEVNLTVPSGTNISVIENKYSDIWEDQNYDSATQSYWIGKPDEDGGWMTYNECVEFCGFAEGNVKEASCTIDGNGEWAQGMISRKDFSGLAIPASDKAKLKRTSNRYWAAHKRGQTAAAMA